jgi:hypothetical protein
LENKSRQQTSSEDSEFRWEAKGPIKKKKDKNEEEDADESVS